MKEIRAEWIYTNLEALSLLLLEFLDDNPAPRPPPSPAARIMTMAKIRIQKINGLTPQNRPRSTGVFCGVS